jgi:hypothetical protein
VCSYSTRKDYSYPALLRIRRPSGKQAIIIESAWRHSTHKSTVPKGLSSPVKQIIRSKMGDKSAKLIADEILVFY